MSNFGCIIGRLTRDPESNKAGKGTVTKFGIAHNRKWGDKEKTTFVDCEAWDKTGEALAKHVKKGDAIFIHYSLEMDSWEDKNGGGKRTKLFLRVNNWEFLPGNKKTEDSESTGGNGNSGASTVEDNGDIPF